MHKVVKVTQLTLEEVDSLVSDQIARQVLRCVHTAHNQGAVAISAFPQLEEIGLLLRLFEFDRTAHHGNCICRVISCAGASKAADSLLGLSESTLADEPPRRFRRDEEENSERSREHPL
jgi:hypothetical protein